MTLPGLALGRVAGSDCARVMCAQNAGACARSGLSHARARAAGIFLTGDPSKESIFLNKRKGFVRMAIQAGAGARHPPRHACLHAAWCSFCSADGCGACGGLVADTREASAQTWCRCTMRASASC
jgi:hypothetical protein